MAAKQNILGLIDAGREIRRPPLVGMQFLHERSVSTSDLAGARTGRNAKDLISFLFRHFAARRGAAPLPRCRIVLARVHASGAPGGQDKPLAVGGYRYRCRRSSRPASADRAHRAMYLHIFQRECGRASRRCRDQAPFPGTQNARAKLDPNFSACVRRRPPATAISSRASRAQRPQPGRRHRPLRAAGEIRRTAAHRRRRRGAKSAPPAWDRPWKRH